MALVYRQIEVPWISEFLREAEAKRETARCKGVGWPPERDSIWISPSA